MLASQLPALKFRNFRLFLAGQFISLIGTWMQTAVLPMLTFTLTEKPILLGLLGFSSTLPALLFILPGGVIIERLNKKRLLVVLQTIMMLQAFTLAFLALTNRITYWHILVLAFILGSVNALEITTRQSLLVQLVDHEALPNAIALNSTIFNAARVIGPTLAVPFFVLLSDIGAGWAFFANGVSYLFVIIGLLLIKLPVAESSPSRQSSPVQQFLEGVRYIRATPLVFGIIAMITIPAFWGFPFLQQLPAFSKMVISLPTDPESIVSTRNSLLLTFQGVGAFIAAGSLSILSHRFKRKPLLMLAGQIAFASALITMSFLSAPPLAYAMMAILGWGMVTQMALSNTLIQLSVPDALRSRVVSVYLWALQGVAPFGSLVIGGIAQTLGISQALLIGGIICLAGYFVMHWFHPNIRKVAI
jgi:MFS family permease